MRQRGDHRQHEWTNQRQHDGAIAIPIRNCADQKRQKKWGRHAVVGIYRVGEEIACVAFDEPPREGQWFMRRPSEL